MAWVQSASGARSTLLCGLIVWASTGFAAPALLDTNQMRDRSWLANDGVPVAEKAIVNNLTWLVSILVRTSSGTFVHHCAGVLVSNDAVLTAAHCMVVPPGDLRVAFATNNPSRLIQLGEDASQLSRGAASVVIHPGYRFGRKDHDLAIIVLARTRADQWPAKASPRVLDLSKLVNFSVKSGSPPSVLTGFGWGVDETGKSPDSLQSYRTLGSTKQCQMEVDQGGFCPAEVNDCVTSRGLICTGPSGTGTACAGDSGGPLVLLDEWQVKSGPAFEPSFLAIIGSGLCGAQGFQVHSIVDRTVYGWVDSVLDALAKSPSR